MSAVHPQGGDAFERTVRGDVWYLKPIRWTPDGESEPRELKIITQNFNGPCSLISLCAPRPC